MASLSNTKINAVPWPALVGASMLLHMGALAIGMPRLVQVDRAASPGLVEIPVALVDADESAATEAVRLPQAAPPSPVKPVTEAVPIGGETPVAADQVQQPVEPVEQSSRPQAAPESEVSKPDLPDEPGPSPVQETEQPPRREPVVKQPPLDSAGPETSQAGEQTDGNGEAAEDGPTHVIIAKITPTDTVGKTPPQADFALGMILPILVGHNCDNLSKTAAEARLPAVVEADGFLSFDHGGQGSAECLAIATIRANADRLTFKPARSNTVFKIPGEEVVAANIDLHLEFVWD
ncbi:MAG: hypothetical protein AAF579_20955 [Cyanobacteria bacterium P01_C01_bin.118]